MDGLVCKDIVIELDNSRENHFMDEADVLRLVEGSGQSIKGTSLDHVDLRAIEKRLKQDKHILDADLYGDLKGNLVVNVELTKTHRTYCSSSDAPDAYIAEDGVVMSVSDKYTSRVVLISGGYAKQLIEMGDLSKHEEGRKLMEMIEFINDDKVLESTGCTIRYQQPGKDYHSSAGYRSVG
jgi:cell division protein FtsQ